MNAINALVSSAPKPKKKRINKPLTKPPPAKIDVQLLQSDRTSNEKGIVLGGDVTQTPAKSGRAKKNKSRKTASLNSSDAMNSNTHSTEVTPLPSFSPPLKEPLEEEHVSVAAHSEAKTDQRSEKKKKRNKMNEDTLGENLKETLDHGIDSKEETNKESVAPNNIFNDHGSKTDSKGNVDDGKELIGNVEITESIVQQKKLKKKKKNKSEDILEQKTEGEINSEKTIEDNTVQSKKAKKKKKREKIDADSPEKTIRVEEMQIGEPETKEKAGENDSEQISNERKRKKKRKHREEDSELVVENRTVFEEQKDEENVTNPSECTDKEENHERTAELNHKSRRSSSIKNDSLVLTSLLPSHETLGLPSVKKKSE